MDRWTDGQTDKSDFIGRCPTNIERPKIQNSSTVLIFNFVTENDYYVAFRIIYLPP